MAAVQQRLRRLVRLHSGFTPKPPSPLHPLPLLLLILVLGHAVQVQADQGNPRIVEHPVDDYVAKGEPATLNCKAEGDPQPRIEWYRDGQKVTTAPESPASHRMLLDTGQLFFLRIIHSKNNKPDVGVYYCNATNVHGSAISHNATLQIAVLRDEFREIPTDVTVAAGETATFSCKPPKGEPEPRVAWRRHDQLLSEGGRFTMPEDGRLVISDVLAADAGQYTCLAINKAGERESGPVTLTVQEKPKFRELPEDLQANEGDTVELKCKAAGDPEPSVQWRRENGRIPYGRARKLTDGTLRIENVEEADDGTYVCMAENAAGTVEAVGRLTVQTHPSFVVTPKDVEVGLGRSITLQCVIKGNPQPTIFWSKKHEQALMFPNQPNGRRMVSQDGFLRISQVTYEDAGEYVCQALNAIGGAKASAVLTVKKEDLRPPPIINVGPQNQTGQARGTAVLDCRATGDPQPVIRWYKDSSPIDTTDPRIMTLNSGALQVSDLKDTDTANYTCKAISETGETSWSAYLTVTKDGSSIGTPTQADFPGPPSKPVISHVTDTSVYLTWQANRNPGNSIVFAFIVEYFCYDDGEGWRVASNSVTRESYTVRGLKHSSKYVFLVRAQNSHGISQPSPMSDIMTTREARTQQLHKEEVAALLSGEVVEMGDGDPISDSAVRLSWKVLKGEEAISGFIIEYKQILSMSPMTYGHLQTERVSDPYARSSYVSGLQAASWYELCVKAANGDITSLCSRSIKIPTEKKQTGDKLLSVAPENIVVHKDKDDSIIHVRWTPPPASQVHSDILGYDVECIDTDRKDNCSVATNASTFSVLLRTKTRDATYRIRVTARTARGLGEWSRSFAVGPEQPNIMKEPWFIGMLIATIGGTLWLALCIFSIWLCHKRKNKKKLGQNGLYSAVPVHKSEESARGSNAISRDDIYSQKDGNMHGNISGYGGLQSDLTSLLDTGSKELELKEQNVYNTAGVLPQMKTFYQKPSSMPISVAPYATTTLINTTTTMQPRPSQSGQQCGDSAFRPINHAYVHSSASGSGDSCQKPDLRGGSDSNTDTSRPNTGCPNDQLEGLASPSSDSGSLTTDEYGMPVKRAAVRKVSKPCGGGKQPMVNWAELLPPPPEHPPPSDLNTPPDSPSNTLGRSHHGARSPLSPVSKLSACSCPVGQDTRSHCLRSMPYSDTEFTPCRPYSPKGLPPHGGIDPRYPHYPCHHPLAMGGMYPHGCHSDGERGGFGGYSVASLHGYKPPPSLDGGCHHYSDVEGGHMCAMHELCSPEAALMDRACQSSLPSLASECVHSPGCPVRTAESPGSEELVDYVGESDLEAMHTDCHSPDSSVNGEGDGSVSGSVLAAWASVTEQSNSCSSLRSSENSSDSEASFLAETDFASTVARAAELSGLTVVGTTITDPKTGKKYRKHRAPRPTSPYSTDSNFSAVVHKPYPKSQRKKQLEEQARKYGQRRGNEKDLGGCYPQEMSGGDSNCLEKM